MTVVHLKKKDVIKSSVKGIGIEFDHEQWPPYLVCTGRNGIREYIEEVWAESKYTKPLEITRRFANDEALTSAGRVKYVIKKGEEPKKYDFFEDTFLTMCELTRENGIWWIGSGENRRRDNDVRCSGGRGEKMKMKGIRMILSRKAMIDEATIEGNRGRERSFMMLEEEARGSRSA
ncbi:hypothetical protein Dimus_001054 [Dionaea muscipula]